MNIKRTLSLLALSLLLNLQSVSQTVPQPLIDILDHTLDSMHTVVPAKSLSAAIKFHDGAIWKNVSGISSVSPAVNATTSDTYLIGSVVKTITSACILQLHDEGTLSIEDSIHDWLPTMEFVNPDITIRQLLQHTSGLYDVMTNPNLQNEMLGDVSHIWSAQEVLDTFLDEPNNTPGAQWSYCNTNYFLLGMIIEAATGNPYYTEYRNRFFTPLNLTSFGIPAFEDFNQPIAHVWMDLFGTGETQDAHFFYQSYLSLNSIAGAAGGYYATPEDVTEWMHSYMRGDLLQPATLEDAQTTMTAPGLPSTTYGLGLNKKTFAGYTGYGHGGDLAYCASSCYFPALDISITVCGNDADYISWDLIPVVRELLQHITESGLVNVSEFDAEPHSPEISIYPNPTNGVTSVDISAFQPNEIITIEVISELGERLEILQVNRSSSSQQLVEMNIQNYATGIYYFKCSPPNGNSSIVKVLKS
ncbi:MAG: hypothetical protein RL204_123 [Bacteroidota bacterium]